VSAIESTSELYSQHLQNVSRSFAFCIEQLEPKLQEWIGLSYILCRLADTIEDSLWPDLQDQLHSFEQFAEFLKDAEKSSDIEAWTQAFPSGLPEGEKLLLNDAKIFIGDLHALPKNVRDTIRMTVLDMTDGMKQFCEKREATERKLRLSSLPEANQYCFFVAGVIGELLSDLLKIEYREFALTERVLTDAYHFGLYLQKINLLKDQMGDEKEGRFLVPDREKMRQSLTLNARHAMDYIKSIPISAQGYRIFCAWSFFLGLRSLPWIDRSWSEKRERKISRTETFFYLSKVRAQIDDNSELEALFEENQKSLHFKEMNSQAQIPTEKTWFEAIYRGRLRRQDMQELGMF
jgi:phytoene/squalene synthetase